MALGDGTRTVAKKSKNTSNIPDDYFAAGPFEFARFGRTIISRSRATEDEHAKYINHLATQLPNVVTEIDKLVQNVAARIAKLPPEQLLQRAWWQLAIVATGIGGASLDDPDQFTALRMIDYVQSIAASIEPHTECADHVSEEEWAALEADVASIFLRVSREYQACLTASKKLYDPNFDMALEEFRVRAENAWVNIRGKRYQAHELQALTDVLSPHTDILSALFGIDAPTLISELEKILHKLTRGLGDALYGMEDLKNRTMDHLVRISADISEEPTGTGIEELRERVFSDDADLAAQRDRVVGELFGLDLFDVAKITKLPMRLLDELTWSPGEEVDFLAPGEFCGWPLRVWPTMKRPFIRLQGRILCFDLFTLFDNFYRVLQRIILRLEPGYKQDWNQRQKTVSEELPFQYLLRLLPGALIYRSVYYRWKTDTGSNQWHEADGILIFDDHLFVIEIKAGSFTYTSPATDLPAHLASLRGLVLAPATQGNRFIDYLESAPEVALADANHKEIGKLRRSDFRHVTPCAITLDQFTELAARSRHLRKVGVDVGQRPVWVLSIDDLRVYADLIDNPLVFLHFVEQRMLADISEVIDLNDEMDHLGLYLANNNYSLHATKIVGRELARIDFSGYRSRIDNYYTAVGRGDPVPPPRQPLPTRLEEIVAFLGRSAMPKRSAAVSFILDSAGEFRTKLANLIEQQLSDIRTLRRSRPLSVYDDMPFTLFCWSPSAPRDAVSALKHVQTVMAANSEKLRHLLELNYTETGDLKDVYWQKVESSSLSEAEQTQLQADAIVLREKRVSAARKRAKIGANEKCPCGSGLKYKRCHRR